MCKFWKKSHQFQSTAKVVDGNLILSLPDAINPIVWRMELGSVKSSALEVRANDNNYLLTLKTPRGDVHDIAPFTNRDSALHALMSVSEALGKAEGKMAPQMAQPQAANSQAAPASRAGLKWLIALGCIIAVIFLFSALSNLGRHDDVIGSDNGTTVGTPTPGNNAESGVPLSADDYLRGN